MSPSSPLQHLEMPPLPRNPKKYSVQILPSENQLKINTNEEMLLTGSARVPELSVNLAKET
jgi:hypothetical protein